MFMQINLLIMRSYLKIGVRYDKRNLRWYDIEYAQDLLKSLKIAIEYYKYALPYWQKAVKYAKRASKIKLTTDLGKIESDRYSIITGELNFKKIIKTHILRATNKQNKLKSSLQNAAQ